MSTCLWVLRAPSPLDAVGLLILQESGAQGRQGRLPVPGGGGATEGDLLSLPAWSRGAGRLGEVTVVGLVAEEAAGGVSSPHTETGWQLLDFRVWGEWGEPTGDNFAISKLDSSHDFKRGREREGGERERGEGRREGREREASRTGWGSQVESRRPLPGPQQHLFQPSSAGGVGPRVCPGET